MYLFLSLRVSKSNGRGFTLAELLIALVILAVIATFAIPKVLQSEQDSRKKAIFKEDFSALQQIVYGLLQDGTLQLSSRGCGTNSSVDATMFTPSLNYTKLTSNTSADVVAQMPNGSEVEVHIGGMIDLNVDWDGSSHGANTWGDDKVQVFFNDRITACNSVNAGQFGPSSSWPIGYVTQNQTCWYWIWQ